MEARFEPRGPLRGTLRPPPDKSISHRAALLAAMGDGPSLLRGYLDSADTRSTLAAVQALGADVDVVSEIEGACDVRDRRDRPAGAGAGGDRRRQRGHAAAAPAGMARRSGRGRVAPGRRRVDPPPARRPDRGAAGSDGGGRGVPRRTAAAARRSGRGPAGNRVRAAGRLGAGEVLCPARRAAGGRPDDGDRAGVHPRPHGADAGGGRGGRRPGRRARSRWRRRESLSAGERTVPADFSSAAFWIVAGAIVAGQRDHARGGGTEPDAHRAARDPRADGGGGRGGGRRKRAGESRSASFASAAASWSPPSSPERRSPTPSTSCRWSPSPPASPRVRRRSATRRSCGARSRIASRRSPRRCAASGPRWRRCPTAWSWRGRAACPAERSSPRGITASRCSVRSRGLASEAGATVSGMEAAGVSYPTFERDLARLVT